MKRVLRFNGIPFLLGTTFIALIYLFTQSESGGTRFTFIEAVSFSPDESSLIVVKLAARNANTPFKFYKTNISRTVSRLDATHGHSSGVIHQDFKAGNCGGAFRSWRVGRTSALSNPLNDHVTMSAFGSGDVTCNVGTAKSVVLPRKLRSCHLTYSKSGRFLAATGDYELIVWDTQNDSTIMQVQANDLPFVDAALMSFTSDETRIVVASGSGVSVWDIATATQLSIVIEDQDLLLNAIAVASDDTVIVCSENWVRRYDFTGQIVATIANSRGYLCCVSADGKRLAVYGDGSLTIYDLSTNKILQTIFLRLVTAIAMSAEGKKLAVGDYDGRVSLLNLPAGGQVWSSSPPARYRWPLSLPAVLLVGWIYMAWRFN